jgi:hypothetical protein
VKATLPPAKVNPPGLTVAPWVLVRMFSVPSPATVIAAFMVTLRHAERVRLAGLLP